MVFRLRKGAKGFDLLDDCIAIGCSRVVDVQSDQGHPRDRVKLDHGFLVGNVDNFNLARGLFIICIRGLNNIEPPWSGPPSIFKKFNHEPCWPMICMNWIWNKFNLTDLGCGVFQLQGDESRKAAEVSPTIAPHLHGVLAREIRLFKRCGAVGEGELLQALVDNHKVVVCCQGDRVRERGAREIWESELENPFETHFCRECLWSFWTMSCLRGKWRRRLSWRSCFH